jgi:hypothetical protein
MEITKATTLRAEKIRETAKRVRELVESLDELVMLTAEERARLAPSANVPDDFILLMANAIQQTAVLGGCTTATPAGLRDTLEVDGAYEALAGELELLQRSVRDTMRVQRAEAGTEALRVYAVAQKLTRPSDAAAAVPNLTAMRRALGRGAPRRKKTEDG